MKFKKGDIIKSIAEPDLKIRIDDIVNTLYTPMYTISYITTPKGKEWLLGYINIFTYPAAIDNDFVLDNNSSLNVIKRFENVKDIIEKSCTCDSKTLFNVGCKCGAVVPYKQTWK
jgi:hypothetical protein